MKQTDILIFAALLAVPYMLEAQDGRNQTVVVTNKFSFDSSAIEKHQLEMAVPDTLNVFEQSFNYSVFDKPYEGAYEFKPYNLNLKPVTGQEENKQFWMKAGIGYTLFPELDLVYEPVRGKRCSFGIFARHRSFAGDYRKLGVDADELFIQARNADGKREYWGGWNYDMDNEAGLNFSYDWARTGLSLTAAYTGLQQRDWLSVRSLDQAVADLKVYSKRPSSKVINYAAYLSYRFGRDNIQSSPGNAVLFQHNMRFGFDFTANMKKKGCFSLYAGADVALYSNALTHTALVVEFLPKYVWQQGPWYVKAGLRLDIPVTTDEVENWNGGSSFSQYAYPDVSVSYECRNIPLNIYLNVTGGERLRSYSSIVDDYRHYSIFSRHSDPSGSPEGNLDFSHPLLKNEVERVNAEFGLRGSIRSVFSYNLSVSYAEKASLALEAIDFASLTLRTGENASEVPYYSIGYANAGQLNARAEAEYSDDWGTVGLKLLYTDLYLRNDAPQSYILPAALTGNLDIRFNIMKRLHFGLGCEFSTPRQVHCGSAPVQDFKIPAYGDPYLSAGYTCNNMISVWIKANRFTGQTIYSTPLYSERGPKIIAGMSLSF